MTPFMQLRLWWRRGTVAQRASASLATLIVLALAAWVLIPTGSDDGATTVASGGGVGVQGGTGGNLGGQTGKGTKAGGQTGSGGTTKASGSGGSSQSSAGGGGSSSGGATPGAAPAAGQQGGGPASGAPAAGGGKQCLQAPDGTPGVSDDEIHIAVGVLELAGAIGNSAAGVASAEELERIGQAAIDDINGRGGVQCRKLVGKFYRGNPINQDQQRATCLEIVQDRPFLFSDAGAFAYPFGSYNCLSQQEVPTITPVNITGSDVERFAPYVASLTSDSRTAMYTAVFGAKAVGAFDPRKGFKKLGLLFEDCTPEFNREMEAALAKAGVTKSQISKYEFPCPPGGFAPPSQMSQAVIQHRRDGVSHVMFLTGGGSQKPYTQTADGQGFHPTYLFNDYNGMMVTAGTATGPSGDTIDGAIGITTGRFGEDTTPGFQPGPGTKRCQAIIKKAGLSPDYVYGKQGGTMCDAIWAAEAAMKGAQTLTREAALPGLFNAGTIQYSYPSADATYRAPAKFYGGDTWWAVTFRQDCNCWRASNPSRKPSFAP